MSIINNSSSIDTALGQLFPLSWKILSLVLLLVVVSLTEKDLPQLTDESTRLVVQQF